MRFRKSLLLVTTAILGCSLLRAQIPGRDLQKEAAIWAQLDLRAPGLLETFKEATTQMDQEKFPEAAALYQKVVDAQPEFDPAVRRLGICLVLGGDVERGLPFAEKAVQLNRSPENLSSLAQLLPYQGKGSPVSLQVRERAFRLAMEAQQKNPQRDAGDTMLIASLALDLEKEKEFRDATGWLIQKHPELPQSHYFNAILAVWDSRWSLAEEEIRQAGKLGLDKKVVDDFLQSGVQTRAAGWRYARYSAYLVGVWAIGLLLLFISGKALSKRVIASTTGGPVAMSAASGLRKTYSRLINLAGLYYYVSQPSWSS
jgi:tetratricopeptide (TPR) repeat protein